MARRLSDDLNTLNIRDNLSGSDIVFSYRMPTTKERIAYTNESFSRKGRKVKSKVVETRIKYALQILQGIREGDFEIKKDGEFVTIASDPKSSHYIEEWKDHIKQHAADLLELLALQVFDAPASTVPEEDTEEDEEDAEKN
jgi:hypothetical protein